MGPRTSLEEEKSSSGNCIGGFVAVRGDLGVAGVEPAAVDVAEVASVCKDLVCPGAVPMPCTSYLSSPS